MFVKKDPFSGILSDLGPPIPGLFQPNLFCRDVNHCHRRLGQFYAIYAKEYDNSVGILETVLQIDESKRTMSCAQVMYQPYGGYLTYERQGAGRMQEDTIQKYHGNTTRTDSESSAYIRAVETSMHSATAVTAPPIPSNGSSNSSCAPPAHTNSPKPETRSHPVIQVASPGHLYERKKEEREDEEGDDRKEMRYLSANCVLFTSYAGDSSSVVEEHFNRALGQTNYDVKGATSKAPSPMTQRNFPPSFWNGNYQLSTGSRSTSSYGLSAHPSHDFYNSMAEAYHSSLHPQLGQDPWSHYQLSSQAYFASAYGGVANNRFAPQYGSLLLHQPGPSTSRLGPVTSTSHCPSVKAEPWNGRYGDSNPSLDITGDHPPSGYHGPAHTYSGVTALEGGSGSLQDYPKDLYWF